MMGIGRRSAFARIAHLFCELYLRFKAVGLTNGAEFSLPITQAEIGDALGLSTVHVNRTLQELRGENLIVLRGGSLTVPDWEALKEAGEFDSTYLQQDRKAGAGQITVDRSVAHMTRYFSISSKTAISTWTRSASCFPTRTPLTARQSRARRAWRLRKGVVIASCAGSRS
jgi:hypothetical protein